MIEDKKAMLYKKGRQLAADQEQMVRRELSSRKDQRFHDPARQELLLHCLRSWITRLGRTVDIDPRGEKDSVTELAASLGKTIEKLMGLKDLARNTIEWGDSGEVERFLRDAERLQMKVERAAVTLKMPSGRYQHGEEGHQRFIVGFLAKAWFEIFEEKPSASENGTFAQVANLILSQMNLAEIGKDGLRSLLTEAGI